MSATTTPAVEMVRVADIRELETNWKIYRRPAANDPAFAQLFYSIQSDGITTPIEISADNVVISGHRAWPQHGVLTWSPSPPSVLPFGLMT
jgi:hypothetical protein